MKTLFIAAAALIASVAQAHTYKYTDLMLKDYDVMNKQVQIRVRKAQKLVEKDDKDPDADHQAIDELRDALRLIFSRPNSDNMVSKLIPDVRRDLNNLSAYEDSIAAIATEALTTVKDSGETIAHRATSLFVLENIMSEIRPRVSDNEDYRHIIQKIADADVKISKDVSQDLKVRSMFTLENPSDQAKEILQKNPEKKK